MKKLLFSILGTFMVSTMASAQYVNVKLDDGTCHSYKTSSKTEVSFGDKKGTELTPSGYYSKDEVDAMLRRIDEELQVNHYTLENHQMKFVEHEEIFRKHEKKLAEHEKKIEELEKRLEALEAK